VADKIVKAKQPEKTRPGTAVPQPSRFSLADKLKPAPKAIKTADKDRGDKPKKENSLARFYRESVGELRKVAWPTVHDTRRLTTIVLVVMFLMSIILGLLDFLFSKAIALLIA
jgi:preprotein translocase subunit SecE